MVKLTHGMTHGAACACWSTLHPGQGSIRMAVHWRGGGAPPPPPGPRPPSRPKGPLWGKKRNIRCCANGGFTIESFSYHCLTYRLFIVFALLSGLWGPDGFCYALLTFWILDCMYFGKTCHWEYLVGPFWVHKLLCPRPPSPLSNTSLIQGGSHQIEVPTWAFWRPCCQAQSGRSCMCTDPADPCRCPSWISC